MSFLDFKPQVIENQLVSIKLNDGISLYIKREDKNHEFVSGNKFRKLKYNILQAKKEGKTTLLTFGGAFSNHIAAVASAGQLANFKTIGVIRGDELSSKIEENPTLKFAQNCGMEFIFISREAYREKEHLDFLSEFVSDWKSSTYVIPEGGTNDLAVKGCQEILTPNDAVFDVICTAVGTAGTMAGLVNSSFPHQKIIGFPALNGEFLAEIIKKYTQKTNWQLIFDYNLGGYAKTTDDFISFLNRFYKETGIPLDPIYTGKMIFGIISLSKQHFFAKNTKILAIHTGGLQGIAGFNQKQLKKNKEILNYD